MFANSETALKASPPAASSDIPQLKPVSSTDSSTASEFTADNAPSARIETVLKAADFSPDTVTSPLEALALACVAERATEELHELSNEFTCNDVLCGRGGLTNNAPGNKRFRTLVSMKQKDYLLATKREKAGVAREIVEAIRSLDPPGRFLKKDSNGVYRDIGDRKAREKTSQALREGAPNIRSKLTITPAVVMDTAPMIMTTTTQDEQAPHVIGQAAPFLPHKFLKSDAWMPSNRARVVSDDSVGIQASMAQEANTTTSAGSKRKVACALEEQRHDESVSNKRGPRLKLFKSRLMA